MTREELIELCVFERKRIRKITKHRPYKAKAILMILRNRR